MRGSAAAAVAPSSRRRLLSTLLLAPLLLASAYLHACSSDDAVTPAQDAGNQEAATPGNDGGDAGAATCEPSTPARASKFVPYRPYQPGACTNAQLSGYYKTCLLDGRAAASCEAFKQQNAACFGCIDSDEDSPTWGPIVWFRKNMYSETNIPGCVAQQLAEPANGDQGCGAADGKFDDCARLACAGCRTEDTDPARTELFDCLNAQTVDVVCAADLSRINTACAGHIDPPPNDPTNLCFRTTANESFDTFALRYIQHWCGPPVDGGIADASTD